MDYRAILQTLRDAIVVADASGTVIFANAAATRMLGYEGDALRGRALASLLPERLRERDHPLHAALFRREPGGAAEPVHATALTATGQEIPVDVTVERTAGDGQTLLVWELRSGAERALLQSRLAVSDALAAMADAFVQMNANPEIAHITRLAVDTLVLRLGGAAARIWLYDRARGRLELHAWAGMSPALDRADAIGAEPGAYGLGLAEVVHTRAPRVASLVDAGDPKAVPEWFRAEKLAGYALHPLVFADQLMGVTAYYTREPIPPELFQAIAAFARHIAVAIHDVREQAQARRQIEALASEAHARTGEFEAIVSNMPDAVFVARGGRIAFVNRSAARMLGFENPADLQVSLEEFARLATVRNPDGSLVTPEDLTLTRVLSGEVITGKEQRMTNVRTVREEKGEAKVEVRDEGIGIAPEERAQIFERYFRAGSVPHTQYGGLGLGLWIAGKVVQRHGGRIDLESTPGQGSTFSVTLPLAHAAVPAAEEKREKRTRILVVDDDLAVLDALKGLLDDDGYEVRVARSGTEAISEARAWTPDVMLRDLRMPGMDGW
jgi:PAS domain S-box-containing protein